MFRFGILFLFFSFTFSQFYEGLRHLNASQSGPALMGTGNAGIASYNSSMSMVVNPALFTYSDKFIFSLYSPLQFDKDWFAKTTLKHPFNINGSIVFPMYDFVQLSLHYQTLISTEFDLGIIEITQPQNKGRATSFEQVSRLSSSIGFKISDQLHIGIQPTFLFFDYQYKFKNEDITSILKKDDMFEIFYGLYYKGKQFSTGMSFRPEYNHSYTLESEPFLFGTIEEYTLTTAAQFGLGFEYISDSQLRYLFDIKYITPKNQDDKDYVIDVSAGLIYDHDEFTQFRLGFYSQEGFGKNYVNDYDASQMFTNIAVSHKIQSFRFHFAVASSHILTRNEASTTSFAFGTEYAL